ncbi:aggregation-promoting factor C-terminal-like domain-containing protein [Calidifontibacter terrae]
MSRRRGRHYAPRRSNRPAAIATVAVASGAAVLSTVTDGASAGTVSSASLRISDAEVSYAPSVQATPDAMRQAIAQRSQQSASRSQQRVSATQAAAALRAKASNANALHRLSLSTAAKPFTQPAPAVAAAPAGKHAATAAPKAVAPKKVAPSRVATYSGDPRSIAMSMLASYGWSSGQFGCLNNLWNKESGWTVGATNGSSGAYGIPQSLPGSKMASAGSDWRTNPATQIRWGLGYIKASYGSPCGAWAHSVATNWY